MPMSVGYARVSTQEQDLALQLDALQAAGCERIFTEKASGAQRDRPQLQAALDYMRADDTLVVWKLDRLARSLRHFLWRCLRCRMGRAPWRLGNEVPCGEQLLTAETVPGVEVQAAAVDGPLQGAAVTAAG